MRRTTGAGTPNRPVPLLEGNDEKEGVRVRQQGLRGALVIIVACVCVLVLSKWLLDSGAQEQRQAVLQDDSPVVYGGTTTPPHPSVGVSKHIQTDVSKLYAQQGKLWKQRMDAARNASDSVAGMKSVHATRWKGIIDQLEQSKEELDRVQVWKVDGMCVFQRHWVFVAGQNADCEAFGKAYADAFEYDRFFRYTCVSEETLQTKGELRVRLVNSKGEMEPHDEVGITQVVWDKTPVFVSNTWGKENLYHFSEGNFRTFSYLKRYGKKLAGPDGIQVLSLTNDITFEWTHETQMTSVAKVLRKGEVPLLPPMLAEWTQSQSTMVCFDTLYMVPFWPAMFVVNLPGRVHHRAKAFRDELAGRLDVPPPAKRVPSPLTGRTALRMLVVGRRGSRRMLNAQDVVQELKVDGQAMLERYGMDSETRYVEFEGLSMAKQVEAVQWADIVIMSTGAGVINACFMQRHTWLWILLPPGCCPKPRDLWTVLDQCRSGGNYVEYVLQEDEVEANLPEDNGLVCEGEAASKWTYEQCREMEECPKYCGMKNRKWIMEHQEQYRGVSYEACHADAKCYDVKFGVNMKPNPKRLRWSIESKLGYFFNEGHTLANERV